MSHHQIPRRKVAAGGLDRLSHAVPQELFRALFWLWCCVFYKTPSPIETINDLDGEIVNLFRTVRERPEALERALSLTPYSRQEYDLAWERRKAGGTADPVEAARLTLVRYWQAVGSRQIYRAGWRRDVAGREAAYTLRNWVRLPERMADAMERLREAQIEQTDAVELIRRFAHPDVLIYADPPYVLSTRSQRQYNVEMGGADQHKALLAALLAHPGPVILSGYDSELYNEALQGWTRLSRPTTAENGKGSRYCPNCGAKMDEEERK